MLARPSFLLGSDAPRLRALEPFFDVRGVHKRGLSAGKYEMEDWRRECERRRDGEESWRESSEDEVFGGDVAVEKRDVVWRWLLATEWCSAGDIGAMRIGSGGGRGALEGALGDMVVAREFRSVAVDVVKALRTKFWRLPGCTHAKLLNWSRCCFIANLQPSSSIQLQNLMLRPLLCLCDEVLNTFGPIKSSPTFTNAYNNVTTYNSSSSLQRSESNNSGVVHGNKWNLLGT